MNRSPWLRRWQNAIAAEKLQGRSRQESRDYLKSAAFLPNYRQEIRSTDRFCYQFGRLMQAFDAHLPSYCHHGNNCKCKQKGRPFQYFAKDQRCAQQS